MHRWGLPSSARQQWTYIQLDYKFLKTTTDYEKQHIDLCFISYAYNEYPNLEHRKEMEDFHYIKALLFKKNSCSYFGLFDGHSGKEVGIYLMENLHKILLKNLKKTI